MRVPEPARDVRGVLAVLDTIVDDARADGSRHGWFAALYRRVTRRVAGGISRGEFDDGGRMDRLDTDFANRYFAALAANLGHRRAPRAWSVAFGAAGRPGSSILQHLLLGMNAHINADLGAAAAAVCPGPALDGVRADFDRINALLAEMTDQVQGELGEVSPRIADLDALAGESDEHLAVFSMDAARADAWRLAQTVAAVPAFLRDAVERLADEKAAMLGRIVLHPPGPARPVLARIVAAEEQDVRRVIDVLARE